MDYNEIFSSRVSKMKASKIRELMKYTSMPDIVSFAGGNPDPENFPFADVLSIINKWDKRKLKIAMQYGTTNGFPPLLDKLKKRMSELKKINLENQELFITTGGQQSINLVSTAFINKDDIILAEEPTFIGAIAAFLAHEAKIIGIPIENDGVNIGILEDKIKALSKDGKKPKFFYTIPNFQNPSGVTMSQEKRKKIADLSKKYNLLIVEDDPYGELYFSGTEKDYMPIKSLDKNASIIYISTFSKILCPGFRLGWTVADHPVIEKMSLAKQSADACSTTFGQVIAYDYLESNAIDNYLSTMRKVYRSKKELMYAKLVEFFPKEVKFTNPNGGFFIYAELPKKISAEALFKKVIEKKVAFTTGEPFHTDLEEGDRRIRLAFSNSSEEEIIKGIQIIGEELKKML